MSRERGSFLKFALGMISGVVSGLVVGLLLAPKTGKEMREDLASKSKELKEFTKERFEEFQHLSTGKAVEVAGSIQSRANKISTKLDELARRETDILIQDEVQ